MADDPGCHHRAAIADSRGDFEQTSFCSYRRSLLALNRAAIGVVPAVRAGWAHSKIVGGNQRSNRISAAPLDQGGRPSQVPKSYGLTVRLPPNTTNARIDHSTSSIRHS